MTGRGPAAQSCHRRSVDRDGRTAGLRPCSDGGGVRRQFIIARPTGLRAIHRANDAKLVHTQERDAVRDAGCQLAVERTDGR